MGEGQGEGDAMTHLLTTAECEFAERHRVAHLATADAAGAPHVIPICYALVADVFYFVIDEKPKRTRTALKRLRNIQENPRVAIVIDDYEDDWTRLSYLLIQGHAERVEDSVEYDRALSVLRIRYPQYLSMDLELDTHPLIRITPTRSHLWRAPSG
jgi:PPOX class probable F420-dependent enzyme